MRLKDLTTPLYEIARGPVGGAFGKAGRKPSFRKEFSGGFARVPGQSITPGSMATQDYQSRVFQGKGLEAEVYNRLVRAGLDVRPASRQEDMHDKIDLWIRVRGQEYPAQIKQRQVGDDIVFEVYKDAYDESQPPNGRDITSKAKLYVVQDRQGRGWMANAGVLKQAARDYVAQHGIETGTVQGVDYKITQDKATGDVKLMAFFPASEYGKRIY